MKYVKASTGGSKHTGDNAITAGAKQDECILTIDSPDMAVSGTDPADDFQAVLYNAGKALLTGLGEQKLGSSDNIAAVTRRLNELRNFQYNISFAGEQSSGKSTLINALLEYPLMPTCKLTTTCVGTHIFYSEKPRLVVVDDDTGKRVMDVDCTSVSEQSFQKLKEYACIATNVKIIENLQHFTERNLFDDLSKFTPSELLMSKKNPDHVIVLLMILLTVYVDQNRDMKDRKNEANMAIQKREEVLNFFGFPKKTINYSIKLQWNGEFLKSGMTITDLPGFGSNAANASVDGKMLKGHDDISTDALQAADAMVFLIEPEMRKAGTSALKTMLSNASLKELVNKDDIIIPVLNKIDTCSGSAEVEKSISEFQTLLEEAGVKKGRDEIRLCSSCFGESEYKGIPIERTCFYKKNFRGAYEDAEMDSSSGDVEEITEEVKAKLAKRLKNGYEKRSHLKELKDFFRFTYIQKGKHYKSYAAVLEVVKLSGNTLLPLRTLARNYQALEHLTGDAIKQITGKLSNAAADPINSALAALPSRSKETERISQFVETMLDAVPMLYSNAFRQSLKSYKAANLEIINKFSLFMFSARIDVIPSDNRNYYNELLKKCANINVDITNVNQHYKAILAYISNEIEAMYSGALSGLKHLHSSVSEEMEKAVQELQKSGALEESIITPVNALKDSINHYVQQQIDVTAQQAEHSRADLDRAAREWANAVIQVNTNAVNSYSNSVLKQVKDSKKGGAIFSARDYIKIGGDDGVKKLFEELSLSDNDEAALQGDIRGIGIRTIANKTDLWYKSADSYVRIMFTTLNDEVDNLLNSAVEQLSGSAQEKRDLYEKTMRQIKACETLLTAFRRDVQPLFDLSLQMTQNVNFLKYNGNIFKGILEEEQEAEQAEI